MAGEPSWLVNLQPGPLQTATKAVEAATQGSGLANRPKELELTGRPDKDSKAVAGLALRSTSIPHGEGFEVPREPSSGSCVSDAGGDERA